MMVKHKPKIAILSIRNSYGFGGVFATLKVVHDFSQKYFEPTIFYLSYDAEISAHLRGFQWQSTNRNATFFGMNCVEIGSRWAFWEPGHYIFTMKQWREALKDFDYFFVVSATPIAGHPLVQLDKKFVIWISTSYDQDRTERVKQLKGIRWLINKCAQPAMRFIEKQILAKASHVLALSSYSRSEFLKTLQNRKKEMSICG
ncbi:glycosyltransferase family 4 protein, partial [Candidatus Dependentiae bacterium]|nr:glycosyltransferase family 4 protein [Candidatus Dependentiae bacterium]